MAGMGEVEIKLDGKPETLQSSLRAAKAVNAMGGFGEVYRRLAMMDFDAYTAVIAAGLNKKSSEVEESVYRTGMSDLAEPVAIYVGLLSNGGRSLATVEEPAKTGEA